MPTLIWRSAPSRPSRRESSRTRTLRVGGATSHQRHRQINLTISTVRNAQKAGRSVIIASSPRALRLSLASGENAQLSSFANAR